MYIESLFKAFALLMFLFAGLRVQGSFYLLTVSACISIIVLLPSGIFLPIERRAIFLAVFWPVSALFLFQLAAFFSTLYLSGFSTKDFLYIINVPLLFALGCLVDCSAQSIVHRETYQISSLLSYMAATGCIVSSIFFAAPLKNITASRPHEALFTIGVLLLTYCFTRKSCELPSAAKLISALILISLCLFFRGALSFFACLTLLAHAIALFINRYWRSVPRLKLFWARSIAFIAVIFFITSVRHQLFKWTAYSFLSDDPFNGRSELWLKGIASLPEIGWFHGMKHPIDPHNFIFGNLLNHGWISSFLLVFVLSCVTISTMLHLWLNRDIWTLFILLILFLGASVQPVQFTDGIAYQLSFYLLGLLYSSAHFTSHNPSPALRPSIAPSGSSL